MGEKEDLRDQTSRLRDAARAAEAAVTRIERLQRLTAALASAATAADCAQALSTAGRAALEAQAAFVWLVDARGETLELAAHDGYVGPASELDPYRRFPVDGNLPVCDAFRQSTPLFLESPAARRERYPHLGDGSRAGFQSWAAIPFVGQGPRAIGALSLSFDRPRSFGREERSLIVTMAAQSSLAIERTRLFEAEVRARRDVEQANRAKDEFLAMLGHELRNPLAPIVTALELMRQRAPDLLTKERTIIERQVRHMTRLVDDLLDVSRVARGKVELRRVPIEIVDVVAKALETASPALEARAHQLVLSIPPGGLLVDADEQRLAQVFANLLTNAARYTDPGGRIEIAATARDGRIQVAVRDSGMGIEPEQLPHIFDLFVQGNPRQFSGLPEEGVSGGLGIGLSIVRNLVELHGGTVTAHSEGRGRGSQFVVDLPRAQAAAPSPPSDAAPAPTPHPARRVLIVDDNRDAADSLAEALTDAGHRTAVAYDGPSALELAPGFAPDVVLLDIGLPVMDGYEVARRLRATLPADRCQLVALTGYGLESDRVQAHAAGFRDHLVKPIELEALIALIAQLP
jgi:signal transduction histidine kinase